MGKAPRRKTRTPEASTNAGTSSRVKQEVTPVGFGEADDPPYVVEVHPPKEDESPESDCKFENANEGERRRRSSIGRWELP